MKNYEKYAEEIRGYRGVSFCNDFVIPHILKSREQCDDMNCSACKMLQMIWLFEECEESEEPKTDWSKVEVDTPILVRDTEYEDWYRRYFAEYKDGVVYTWTNGRTSWSVINGQETNSWGFAKLAESEEK